MEVVTTPGQKWPGIFFSNLMNKRPVKRLLYMKLKKEHRRLTMKIELMTKKYYTVAEFSKAAEAADYVENDAYAEVEHVVITHSEGQTCSTVEEFLEDYRYHIKGRNQ